MKKIFIKSISIFLLVVFVLLPFKKTDAQEFPGIGIPTDALTSVVTAVPTAELPVSPLTLAVLAVSAGVGGGLQGTVTAGITELANLTDCSLLIAAVDKFDVAKSSTGFLGSLTFGLVGEDGGEAAKLEAEQAVVGPAQECVTDYLIGLSKIPSFDLNTGQILARKQDEYTKLRNAYADRIEQINERQTATAEKILRAFLLRVLSNVQKDLTTRVVNGLIQKFKISNYLQYASALGGQVYAMDYINANYSGDARQQMMIRSLMQDKFLGANNGGLVAQAFSQQKAEEYLGYDFQNINFDDPDFYVKLAKQGNTNANPLALLMQAEGQADTGYASGLANANLEISSGQGLKGSRDCSGSIQDQEEIDAEQLRRSQTYFEAFNVYRFMTSNLPSSVPAEQAEQIAIAKKALDDAQAALKALPTEVAEPVVKICKAINNPGATAADQINAFLAAHFNSSSDLKPENLPFFATFLSDVASNFVTNIVTGGNVGQLLKETGFGLLDVAVGAAINTTTPGLPDPNGGGTSGGDGGTTPPGGSGGGGGGASGPATCTPDGRIEGVRVACDSLPTSPGQPFTININLNGLPSNVTPEELIFNSSDLSIPPDREFLSNMVKDDTGNYKFYVDNGITKTTRFAFTVQGKQNGQPWTAVGTAAVTVTLPGQVAGVFTKQKVSLRSSTPYYGPIQPRGPRY